MWRGSLPNTHLSLAFFLFLFQHQPLLATRNLLSSSSETGSNKLLNFVSAHTCTQSQRFCCAAATTLVHVRTHKSPLLCCCCTVCACVHTHKSAAALLLQLLRMQPSTHMHTAAHAHTHMYRFRSAAPTNQRRRQIQSYAKCNKHIYRCCGTRCCTHLCCTHQSKAAPNTELRAQCNTHTHIRMLRLWVQHPPIKDGAKFGAMPTSSWNDLVVITARKHLLSCGPEEDGVFILGRVAALDINQRRIGLVEIPL